MAIHDAVALLLLLQFLLLLVLVVRKGKKQKLEAFKPILPPGPPTLPIIGNLHQLTGENPHLTLWELSKQYGPLMHMRFGCAPTVVVSSAEIAKEFLKTHDLKTCSRPITTAGKRLSYNLSDVGFSPNNEMWRHLKKISVIELLSTRKVERLRSLREKEIGRMISSISTLVSLSQPVNIRSIARALSNNVTCSAVFGRSFARGGMEQRVNRLNRIFDEHMKLLVEFFFADHFPWTEWVDVLSGLRRRLEKSFANFDFFLEEIVEEHVSQKPAEDEDEDFVDALLRVQSEDALLTMDHVKGLLMNIIGAGKDTSSLAIEFVMAELARNPSAMVKAQEEVRNAVGNKGMVEESDVAHLSYLKLVVKETLRLHIIDPLLVPHETTEHITVNGYDILPGTRVIVNAWALGRENASWDKPEEFIPERFEGSTVDFKGHDIQFIPFGAGRRICPGLSFGITIIELTLANLLYSFDWEVPGGLGKESLDMTEETGMSIRLKTSLQLEATKHEY